MALALLLLAGCGQYPKDPENTLARVRGGTLRVGATESEPWLTRGDGRAGGIEAELVRGFAQTLDADVEWVWGTQEENLEAIERGSLDLVAGGVTAATPWKAHVGLTRPYARERWMIGAPPGVDVPDDLEGVEVAVPRAGPVAAWVKGKGAEPVPVEDVRGTSIAVAVPEWRLEEFGLRPTDHRLRTVRHVLVVPPGENGLLVALERYLHAARSGEREGGGR